MNTPPPQMNLQSLFGTDMQHVPGLGYVTGKGGANAGLGDESAVMMISGIGDGERAADAALDIGVSSIGNALRQPVTIGPMTQPLWVWLLLATGVVGVAGWFFFLKKK